MGRFLLRLFLLLAVPVVFVAAAGVYYMSTGRYVSTENAYVKVPVTTITTEVSGRVAEVAVAENQRVARGELLLVVAPEQFEIAVRQAEAALANVRQELLARRAAVRQAALEIAVAGERVDFLTTQFEREEKLTRRGVGRGARLDEARHLLRAAGQRMKVVRERERQLRAGLGGKPQAPIERHPLYLETEQRLARARLDLARTRVRAPADGVIARINLEPGEFVQAGKPLFALVHASGAWIEANLKETELTHVRPGQRASFEADAYPGVVWQARVIGISPATGAEFALLPPQNASGNWVKVVQRLPVRLAIDDRAGEGLPTLRAGMTVNIRIDTERERELPPLISKVLAYTRGMVGRAPAP